MKQKSFDIDRDGVDMFLPPLQAAVMRAIWDQRRTSKKIWLHVRENYETASGEEIHYTTVTTTINTLYEEKYLTRTGDKTGYTYAPVCASEREFAIDRIRAILSRLIEQYPREMRDALSIYMKQLAQQFSIEGSK